MAEQVVVVCDVCGRPATSTILLSVSKRSGGARETQKWTKDLCDSHLTEITANARKPRRGRRRGTVGETKPASATRRRSVKAKAAPAAKRRGRPRKAVTASE